MELDGNGDWRLPRGGRNWGLRMGFGRGEKGERKKEKGREEEETEEWEMGEWKRRVVDIKINIASITHSLLLVLILVALLITGT